MEIKIFKPEITSFSVKVKFFCESPSLSGIRKVSEWINYFISLRSINPEGQDDYAKYIAVLKRASFCEALYAEIKHYNDDNRKFVTITLSFDHLDNLTKFVDTIEESVRFN